MKCFCKIKKQHPNYNSIIIGISIIMFWRGLWGLMDMYLFPSNEALSYFSSALIGLFLLYVNDFKLKELE